MNAEAIKGEEYSGCQTRLDSEQTKLKHLANWKREIFVSSYFDSDQSLNVFSALNLFLMTWTLNFWGKSALMLIIINRWCKRLHHSSILNALYIRKHFLLLSCCQETSSGTSHINSKMNTNVAEVLFTLIISLHNRLFNSLIHTQHPLHHILINLSADNLPSCPLTRWLMWTRSRTFL